MGASLIGKGGYLECFFVQVNLGRLLLHGKDRADNILLELCTK